MAPRTTIDCFIFNSRKHGDSLHRHINGVEAVVNWHAAAALPGVVISTEGGQADILIIAVHFADRSLIFRVSNHDQVIRLIQPRMLTIVVQAGNLTSQVDIRTEHLPGSCYALVDHVAVTGGPSTPSIPHPPAAHQLPARV